MVLQIKFTKLIYSKIVLLTKIPELISNIQTTKVTEVGMVAVNALVEFYVNACYDVRKSNMGIW